MAIVLMLAYANLTKNRFLFINFMTFDQIELNFVQNQYKKENNDEDLV